MSLTDDHATRMQRINNANGAPITRVADNYLQISVGRQAAGEHAGKFQLHGRVQVGETVTVVVAPFEDKVVRTWNAHGEELTVTPLTRDEFGFSRGGVEAVFSRPATRALLGNGDAATLRSSCIIEWSPGAGPVDGRSEDEDMVFLRAVCDAFMAGELTDPNKLFWKVLGDREPLLRRVLDEKFGPEYPSVAEGKLLPPVEIRMAASYLLEN